MKQKRIKRLQRRIAAEKAELRVHHDHLLDMRGELEMIIRGVKRAMDKLDDAAGDLELNQ